MLIYYITQIQLPLRPDDPESLAAVLDFLYDINSWMEQNYLNYFAILQQALVPGQSM